MPFELFADVFRLFCLIAFIAFIFSVLRKSKKSDYNKAAQLPLESEFRRSAAKQKEFKQETSQTESKKI